MKNEARDAAEQLGAWIQAEPRRVEVEGREQVAHPAPPVVPQGKVWIPGTAILLDR